MAIYRPLVDLRDISARERIFQRALNRNMALCNYKHRYTMRCIPILLLTEVLDSMHALAIHIHASSGDEVAVTKL